MVAAFVRRWNNNMALAYCRNSHHQQSSFCCRRLIFSHDEREKFNNELIFVASGRRPKTTLQESSPFARSIRTVHCQRHLKWAATTNDKSSFAIDKSRAPSASYLTIKSKIRCRRICCELNLKIKTSSWPPLAIVANSLPRRQKSHKSVTKLQRERIKTRSFRHSVSSSFPSSSSSSSSVSIHHSLSSPYSVFLCARSSLQRKWHCRMNTRPWFISLDWFLRRLAFFLPSFARSLVRWFFFLFFLLSSFPLPFTPPMDSFVLSACWEVNTRALVCALVWPIWERKYRKINYDAHLVVYFEQQWSKTRSL